MKKGSWKMLLALVILFLLCYGANGQQINVGINLAPNAPFAVVEVSTPDPPVVAVTASEEIFPGVIEAQLITTPIVLAILEETAPPPDELIVAPFCWSDEAYENYRLWYLSNYTPIVYPAYVYEPAPLYWGPPVVFGGAYSYYSYTEYHYSWSSSYHGHGYHDFYGHHGGYHGKHFGDRHGFGGHYGHPGDRGHGGRNHSLTSARMNAYNNAKQGMRSRMATGKNSPSSPQHGANTPKSGNFHDNKASMSPTASTHNSTAKQAGQPGKMEQKGSHLGAKTGKDAAPKSALNSRVGAGGKEAMRGGGNQKGASLNESRGANAFNKSAKGQGSQRTSLNQPSGQRQLGIDAMRNKASNNQKFGGANMQSNQAGQRNQFGRQAGQQNQMGRQQMGNRGGGMGGQRAFQQAPRQQMGGGGMRGGGGGGGHKAPAPRQGGGGGGKKR